MEPIFAFPTGPVHTRWASPENPTAAPGAGGTVDGGRKGRPWVPIRAGETLVLAEENAASGTIRRIWITIDNRTPQMLRGLRLECTWDHAETPAVDVPIGDFFCHANGRMTAFENALFSSPEGRSFCCTVPMPFRNAMRIALVNESGVDLPMCFYDIDYTVGETHPPEVLWFHAGFHRENPTRMRHDFTVLPEVHGRGRFLGCTFGVRTNRASYGTTWWGEGEVKAYLDGDTDLPTLCGTGTEDYIGTGWGQGAYAHQYQGCPLADTETGRYNFYRLHIPDPVWFHESARITIQQIGWGSAEDRALMRHRGTTPLRTAENPVPWDESDPDGGIFERDDDWSVCSWFYLDRPSRAVPDLCPVDERIADL